MFELNIDYEVLEKKMEEVKKESKDEKLALMRSGVLLALFEDDVYATDIEAKGCEIARKTLRANNIDLYSVVIEKNFNIVKKDVIQKDIMKEYPEHYQVINENIYTLDDEEEAKEELEKYAEDAFVDMLSHSDAYFELYYHNDICNNCIYHIYEQMYILYNEGYTIYTSDNSFILQGNYKDLMSTRFENYEVILNKKTKENIIEEIKKSSLSETAKKEIISRVETY